VPSSPVPLPSLSLAARPLAFPVTGGGGDGGGGRHGYPFPPGFGENGQ